eukprot:2830455-Amphidinium_carterae.1
MEENKQVREERKNTERADEDWRGTQSASFECVENTTKASPIPVGDEDAVEGNVGQGCDGSRGNWFEEGGFVFMHPLAGLLSLPPLVKGQVPSPKLLKRIV